MPALVSDLLVNDLRDSLDTVSLLLLLSSAALVLLSLHRVIGLLRGGAGTSGSLSLSLGPESISPLTEANILV